jgi:hypothetical protein
MHRYRSTLRPASVLSSRRSRVRLPSGASEDIRVERDPALRVSCSLYVPIDSRGSGRVSKGRIEARPRWVRSLDGPLEAVQAPRGRLPRCRRSRTSKRGAPFGRPRRGSTANAQPQTKLGRRRSLRLRRKAWPCERSRMRSACTTRGSARSSEANRRRATLRAVPRRPALPCGELGGGRVFFLPTEPGSGDQALPFLILPSLGPVGAAKQSSGNQSSSGRTQKVLHPIPQSALTHRLYRRDFESDADPHA